jgi:hypothetical protein
LEGVVADELIRVRVKTTGGVRAGYVLDMARLESAMMSGGSRVVEDLRDFYMLNDQHEPNRFVQDGTGSRRTHFWAQVADSIRGPEWVNGGVNITITDGRIKQKIYGGEIVAKNAKYLTIPIHPEAYARRAFDLEATVGKMFFWRSKNGFLFLAGKYDGRFTLFYLLKTSVNQEPWRTALPNRRFLTSSFQAGVREWLRRN